MIYPKAVMNRKELVEMGFPENYLMRAFSTPGQTFATRSNPANRTSSIIFDTAGFEEWRKQDMEVQGRCKK